MHLTKLVLVCLLCYVVVSSDVTFTSFVHHVTEKYLLAERCVVLISDQQHWPSTLVHHLPAYLVRLDPSSSALRESVLRPGIEAGCSGFIISVSDVSSILSSLLDTARYAVNRDNRRYVILTRREPRTILTLPQLRFTPDLVVAKLEDNSSISVWTHAFTGRTLQEQSRTILLDTWTEGKFARDVNIFPDKLADLRGRQLKFATFNYPPYAILGDDAGSYDGTEMRILAELSRHMNFTWSIVTDNFEWGSIFSNASGNGILGLVSEDRADFGFGAIYLWYHEYQFIDFSVPYIRTGITCLAPRPQPLSGWRAPTLPFSSPLWLAVAVSLAVAATTICVIANLQARLHLLVYGDEASAAVSRLCQPLNCTLLVLGMSTLAPGTSTLHQPSALKHCLTWFLLQCLLLATCYSSSLVSFMTVPRFAQPVESAEDLASRNLHWAATHEAWAFSLRNASDSVHAKVYQLFLQLSEPQLQEAALAGSNLAFAIERLPAGNFALGEYLNDDEALRMLRLMKQDLYWEMVVTVLRKGSPYLHKLNSLIHRLLDSGILLFWEGEVSRKFLSSRDQLTIRTSMTSDVTGATSLAVHHVQGVFLMLGIGLSVALLVFVCELVTNIS